MKRDIFQALKLWCESKRRKPLILYGARQVGKTYSLQHLGKALYKNVAYINFEKDKKASQFFEESLDPREILRLLSIHTEVSIAPSDTLLIFDEIQSCPTALNSLKYFCEEANDYHIAAAGSLLGVKTAREGFPVGKVNILHMHPLTFFEFLSALNHEKLREYLETYSGFDPLPEPLHDKLLSLLKQYFFVGGMPEAVAYYAQKQDLITVREIQNEILDAYERDFAKHAPPSEIMKITSIWGQIPRQLAKENKKFIFAAIRKSARGRDYEDAIQWLVDAGLIHKSHLVVSPKFPLSAYVDNQSFKLFDFDVGLLGAQSELSAKILLEGNELFTEFKGALTENFVTQELIAAKRKIYYWASEATAEIDFLIEQDHEIYPLEVKAGASTKKKSLSVYKEKYAPSKILRSTTMNLKKDGELYNYPLYLVSRAGIGNLQ